MQWFVAQSVELSVCCAGQHLSAADILLHAQHSSHVPLSTLAAA